MAFLNGSGPLKRLCENCPLQWSYTLSANSPALDITEVICMCGDNERPFVEGAELMPHGIICIGKCPETKETEIRLFALVMQASDCDGDPHQVFITIKNENGKRIISGECYCLGGGHGRCKHILAAALRLYR